MSTPTFRLAIVGPLPPPFGGMANQTRQLAELLRDEGVTVEVVQVNAPYHPAWITRLRGLRAVFRLLPYLARLWAAAGRNDLFHVMANSGWSWHLFAAPAIVIAKLRGKAVVVNYRGGEAEAFFARAFSRVQRSLRQADAVVVPSSFLANVFAQRGVVTHVVPNIVNLERFVGGEPQWDAAPHILVARNLEPLYDNASAIRAFAEIRRSWPGARMTIAGSGPEKEALQSLAQALDVAETVSFVGKVENADMPTLYRGAHVSLNPSLADNMPISILEALACGVPVVSTDVGGVPHLVEHEKTALLAPARNPEALAQACLRLLSDRVLAKRLSVAGRELVQDFSWARVRPKLFEVYYRVLRTKRLLPAADAR